MSSPTRGILFGWNPPQPDTESMAGAARTSGGKGDRPLALHLLVGAVESGQTRSAVAQAAEQQESSARREHFRGTRHHRVRLQARTVRTVPTAPMLLAQGLAMQKEIFRASGAVPKTAVILAGNEFRRRHDPGDQRDVRHVRHAVRRSSMPSATPGSTGRSGRARSPRPRPPRPSCSRPICRSNDGRCWSVSCRSSAGSRRSSIPWDRGSTRTRFHPLAGQVQRVPAGHRALDESPVEHDPIAREASRRTLSQ